MKQSTEQELIESTQLILSIQEKIQELIGAGKKVHLIWDFDGVLTTSRSDDIFALTGYDLKTYFSYEEKLLLESPEAGPWLLPIAHNVGIQQRFPAESFTQDIVTARSSSLAIRVHIFCIQWHLPMRWMLFLGHQPKKEAYRIILQSLKSDPDYYVFCIDDGSKHIDAFKAVAAEENMEDRCFPVLAPVIRTYSPEHLKEHYDRVMGSVGDTPVRVRDPQDDMRGCIVLPDGIAQFNKQISNLVSTNSNEGHVVELRNAFVRSFGEVGVGKFKTEDDLQNAMKEFILNHCCP